jgi:hypothetical protein
VTIALAQPPNADQLEQTTYTNLMVAGLLYDLVQKGDNVSSLPFKVYDSATQTQVSGFIRIAFFDARTVVSVYRNDDRPWDIEHLRQAIHMFCRRLSVSFYVAAEDTLPYGGSALMLMSE